MEKIGKEENYMIVFNDGSKKEIEAKTAESILRASTTMQKTFIIGMQFYSFSNISKLVPISEYYEQYQDERPQYNNYSNVNIDNEPIIKTREQAIRAMGQIIKGFKKHFLGREMLKNSKILLETMENRLSLSIKDKKPIPEVRDFYNAL